LIGDGYLESIHYMKAIEESNNRALELACKISSIGKKPMSQEMNYHLQTLSKEQKTAYK